MHETTLPSENNDACDQNGSGLERGPVCMSAVRPEASARSPCQGEDTRVVRRTSKAERQGPQNPGPRRPSRSPLRPAAAPSSSECLGVSKTKSERPEAVVQEGPA